MIFWTMGLVTALGGGVLVFMLQPPAPLGRNAGLMTGGVAVSDGTRGRQPASTKDTSLPEIAQAQEQSNVPQAIDLAMPCKGPAEKIFPSSVRQVRLSGDACTAPSSELKSTEIINSANGYAATVFLSGPRSFTTDYISLKIGENRIRALHLYKTGEREEREYRIIVQHRQ